MIILKIIVGIIILLIGLTVLLNVTALVGYLVDKYVTDEYSNDDYTYKELFWFHVILGMITSLLLTITIGLGYIIQSCIFS